MKCPLRQHENPPQAKFCLECGARVALTCPKCRLRPAQERSYECLRTDGTEPALTRARLSALVAIIAAHRQSSCHPHMMLPSQQGFGYVSHPRQFCSRRE